MPVDTNAETYLGHISFFLTGISFFMRDILYLRVIAIFASLFAIFYAFYGYNNILIVHVFWHSLFILIHVFRVSLLIYEKYVLQLSPRDKMVYDLFEWDIPPATFKKILGLGLFIDEKSGAELIKQGEDVSQIGFILSGTVKVVKNNEELLILKQGQFFGQFSFITGESASSSIIVNSKLSYVCWDQKVLKKYLDKNEGLLPKFQQVLTKKVVESLR